MNAEVCDDLGASVIDLYMKDLETITSQDQGLHSAVLPQLQKRYVTTTTIEVKQAKDRAILQSLQYSNAVQSENFGIFTTLNKKQKQHVILVLTLALTVMGLCY